MPSSRSQLDQVDKPGDLVALELEPLELGAGNALDLVER
jgi:hypothetical protein